MCDDFLCIHRIDCCKCRFICDECKYQSDCMKCELQFVCDTEIFVKWNDKETEKAGD